MIDRLFELAKLENDPSQEMYSKDINNFPLNIAPASFKLLILNFEQTHNSFVYCGEISQLGINDKNRDSLARRLWKISTKGRYPGPCVNYNSKKPYSFIEKICDFFSIKNGINKLELFNCINENKSAIVNNVKLIAVKTTWVSLKINKKFLSEIPEIDKKIKEYINKKKGLVREEASFKKGACYLCHSRDANLVNIFKIPNMAFGTLDKKENISMNLKTINEYKMCSVCLNCQDLFNEDFTNKLLNKEGYYSTFYGLKLLILPSFVQNKESLSMIKESIKRYNHESKNIKDELTAKNKLRRDLKRIIDKDNLSKAELRKKGKIEQDIKNKCLANKYINSSEFGILPNYLNFLIFSVLLYKKASSQFIVYDLIEDISKTRLTCIAEAHEKVTSKLKFNYNIDLILYYKMLLKYQFDEESKDVKKYILKDLINFIKNLVLSSKIKKEQLVKLFMTYVHKKFYKKDENKLNKFLCFEIKKFNALLDFLSELNCLED